MSVKLVKKVSEPQFVSVFDEDVRFKTEEEATENGQLVGLDTLLKLRTSTNRKTKSKRGKALVNTKAIAIRNQIQLLISEGILRFDNVQTLYEKIQEHTPEEVAEPAPATAAEDFVDGADPDGAEE